MMVQARPAAKMHGDDEGGVSTGKNVKQGMLKKIGESKKWDMADDTWGMEDDEDGEDEEKLQLKSGEVLS